MCVEAAAQEHTDTGSGRAQASEERSSTDTERVPARRPDVAIVHFNLDLVLLLYTDLNFNLHLEYRLKFSVFFPSGGLRDTDSKSSTTTDLGGVSGRKGRQSSRHLFLSELWKEFKVTAPRFFDQITDQSSISFELIGK